MLTKINSGVSGLRNRLAKEEGGFTLIELLVVLVIIGVLLAIAVPSYLGFKQRAEKRASDSNVRAAIPAMEAFYSDNGTYVGATLAGLRASYDAGLASIAISGPRPPATRSPTRSARAPRASPARAAPSPTAADPEQTRHAPRRAGRPALLAVPGPLPPRGSLSQGMPAPIR